MKIAICSDAHDNVWNLKAALLAAKSCEHLLFCGDLCSPFIISLMMEHFKNDIHIVFGNNDGDTYRMTKNAPDGSKVHLYGEFFSKELGGKKIAMNHYPEIAKQIAKSGDFDLVCYGHDHVAREYYEGQTLVINPGALMGYNPKPPNNEPPTDVKPTFVVYDTVTGSTAWYVLDTLPKTGIDFMMINNDINSIDLKIK